LFSKETDMANIGPHASMIWSLIIGGITFLVSVSTSMFISGAKWGAMSTKIATLENNFTGFDSMKRDVAIMQHDLAEIKGMFRLTPIDHSDGKSTG
jgi:hypothetical protein